jgi:hypothetical protein
MKSILATLAGLLFMTASAQEKRNVAPYNKIHVTGPYEVTLVSGNPGTISLEGDKETLSHIAVESEDGALTIRQKENFLKGGKKTGEVKITIPVADLKELALNGSGSIKSTTTITSDIKVHLNGSGDINLAITSGTAEALLTGSGDIYLKGSSQNFSCRITGSGSVKADNLQADNVEVRLTGSGDADVVSKAAIVGKITGSGTIAYAGNPEKKDLRKTGSGEFRSKE